MERKLSFLVSLGLTLFCLIIIGGISLEAQAGEKKKDKVDSFLDGVTDKVINATSPNASEADKKVTREAVKGAYDPRPGESDRHSRDLEKAVRESMDEPSGTSNSGSSGQGSSQGTPSYQPDYGPNLAAQASVTASSELSRDYRPGFAIDGNCNTSWLARQSTGEWLKLYWPQAVAISRVIVTNRCQFGGTSDPINSASLLFSDGSQVSIPGMNGYLERQEVTFSPKSVSWIRFQIDQGPGRYSNGGLAEIEVYSR